MHCSAQVAYEQPSDVTGVYRSVCKHPLKKCRARSSATILALSCQNRPNTQVTHGTTRCDGQGDNEQPAKAQCPCLSAIRSLSICRVDDSIKHTAALDGSRQEILHLALRYPTPRHSYVYTRNVRVPHRSSWCVIPWPRPLHVFHHTSHKSARGGSGRRLGRRTLPLALHKESPLA